MCWSVHFHNRWLSKNINDNEQKQKGVLKITELISVVVLRGRLEL